jgi:hypothetical protein
VLSYADEKYTILARCGTNVARRQLDMRAQALALLRSRPMEEDGFGAGMRSL